ncbi:MAG TPA: PIG-L family deacetylase [Anaerolineae bacterium]|nr:PIG-L family deacetylase [Anaerolineae bacterium]HQI85790.1 PIG-L family deacetylase [Anaerolineae bacterium]
MPVSPKKIIVVGAHPDDPETACGGTMTLLAQAGYEVVAAYLTRGEAGIPGTSHQEAAAIRTAEALRACELLDAHAVFLGQIDGQCEVNPARYDEMYRFLENEQPDLIFTHWSIDTHRDHRACSSLVYDAWLRMGRRVPLFYFECMTGQQSQNFAPTDYVNISTVVELKHQACFVHESQHIAQWYANDHGKMEAFRGLECGGDYAEAFVRQAQSPHFGMILLNGFNGI